MFEGTCHGGPLDGQPGLSRCPKGFLLVDRPADRCWIYEWDGNQFRVRDEAPMPVLTDGPVNRIRAAEEPNYDVIAAPWSGGDPDIVDAYAEEG